MTGIIKNVFKAILGSKEKLNNDVNEETLNKSILKNFSVDNISSDRCLRILNYWLNFELFDLPECPMDNRKGIISEPADNFVKKWGQEAIENCKDGNLKITETSQLLVMFQCHRAGYIANDDERHPNYTVPRTYLAAQVMVPHWDEERSVILWSRSEDDQDLIINRATIRTLYRRCRSSIPENLTISDWIEARIENIQNQLYTGLRSDNDDGLLETEELQDKIISINRELADQFWPDKQSRNYMLQQCQPIESSSQDNEKDAPSVLKNGTVTFRWRFCFYPDGFENQQLGPFFVQDLERMIKSIKKTGINSISLPLRLYLLGQNEQIEIGSAANNGDFFYPLTNDIIYGRWPENPNYGLSLLQTVAVNVAKKMTKNPIVAVNGPPGTGKTTLLKDIIADRFVTRTKELRKLYRNDDNQWLASDNAIQIIMDNSIVVASSNNKAVENISKELPSLGKLPDDFAKQTNHFRRLAPKGDWGLFCGVLGNSSNRNKFKPLLKKISEHMRKINDYFQLNHFVKSLIDKDDASEVILQLSHFWKEEGLLTPLVQDIVECSASRKYSQFFEPFTSSLLKVEMNELTVEQLAVNWQNLDDTQWELAIEAIDAFKRQWFAKKLFQGHLDKKLRDAEKSFDTLYSKIEKLECGSASEWQLDTSVHLTSPQSYSQQQNETEEELEKRLQLSSPLGSHSLNQCRSELFIKALALNEALLENSAKYFPKYEKQLTKLIDGRLPIEGDKSEFQQLWSILFLFFPVLSSSLSSIENQFKLMQVPEGFGVSMIDEAGQAVNYHAVGLLQRSRQAIFVGDPIQLEPVVTTPASIDLGIADDFLQISKKDGEQNWQDNYLVSSSSAQSIADNASHFISKIGERKVGIPLLVHRRCTEPMFSIANKIAYDNRMFLASQPVDWISLQSGWINVLENAQDVTKLGYANSNEAVTALTLIQFLVEEQPQMVEGGVYIITPFSIMRRELIKQWDCKARSSSNHKWMKKAYGLNQHSQGVKSFSKSNIGTVHTFQGKEASTVIFCTSASKIRKKEGGINWVNTKPNLLNVAITRAKHHLFILGNQKDWSLGTLSSELQQNGMRCYDGFDQFKQQQALPSQKHNYTSTKKSLISSEITFDFG